ncbi:MAG: hypothetical protein K6C69_06210 [Lachnospiraceae bacterium]|nr:hypothetical protein [Lachnospiraceae bacterium]
MYSYASANSSTGTYLSIGGRNNYALQNQDVWLTGSFMRDYLTCNEEEQFHYGYIVKNETDIQAPLYFMILHTICSFFVGKFSWWYAFSINLVAAVLTMIFLYLLVWELTRQKTFALAVCVSYAFCMWGIDTFIYIRMYALVTAFGTISSYLHVKLLQGKHRLIPMIGLITLLGGLTQMYFLVFEGLISACFCFYYLFQKKWKLMCSYGIAQLMAVVLFLIVHPYVFAEVTAVNDKMDQTMGFVLECKYLLRASLLAIADIDLPIYPWGLQIYLTEAILILAVILIPINIVFRKEIKKIKLYERIWNWIWRNVKLLFTERNYFFFVLGIVIPFYHFITVRTSYPTSMGIYTVRYVFLLYPYVILLGMMLIKGFFHILMNLLKLEEKKYSTYISTLLISITTFVFISYSLNCGNKGFYFPKKNLIGVDAMSLGDLPKGADYITVYAEPFLLDFMSVYLMDSNQIYPTTPKGLLGSEEKLSSFHSEEAYLLLPVPRAIDLMIESDERKNEDKMNDSDDNTTEYTLNDEELVQFQKESYDYYSTAVQDHYMKEYREFFKQHHIGNTFDYVGYTEIFGRLSYVIQID